MDSKNLIIAVLSVTAVVLLCVVVLMWTSKPYPGASFAWADTIDRGGDYVLATGAFSVSNEALYVLDGYAGRLNAYQYDNSRNRIVLYDSLNLNDYFLSR